MINRNAMIDNTDTAECDEIYYYLNDNTNKDRYRVIIAGSRNFCDYEVLRDRCEDVLAIPMAMGNVIIVSGHAKGVDQLGERFAFENKLKTIVFPAEWKKYGRAAGPLRNKIMADNADALIAFWDGESRGTGNMIHLAQNKGLKLFLVQI